MKLWLCLFAITITAISGEPARPTPVVLWHGMGKYTYLTYEPISPLENKIFRSLLFKSFFIPFPPNNANLLNYCRWHMLCSIQPRYNQVLHWTINPWDLRRISPDWQLYCGRFWEWLFHEPKQTDPICMRQVG